MKVITLNVNGLRSAANKGFFPWMLAQKADVICLQEIKAHAHQLTSTLFHPSGYHVYFHNAVRLGYSGVAIYCRHKPDSVQAGLGWPDLDMEGRYLQINLGRLSVVSLYLPSGSSGLHRQAIKFSFMERFLSVLRSLANNAHDYILCGDWNIAHKPLDLKNWRANQKNSGFLPEERAWMDEVLGPVGWTDGFRVVNQESDQYTWWSNRGRAWEKNVGWRIDYQVLSSNLRNKVLNAEIYKMQRFSDHAPLLMTYAYKP